MLATSTISRHFDVVIIGGGPAGLSVALGLARQLFTAIVLDSGVYRNERVQHMHNVLAFDHANPADFRAQARKNILDRYKTIEFGAAAVSKVQQRDDGRYAASDEAGNVWTGRKLVLATGVKDVAPNIDGYDVCWGRGIFHCLFCHGFEERNATSAGVLAVGDCAVKGMALHMARMAGRLVRDVTVYTDGNSEFSDEIAPELAASGLRLDRRPICKLTRGKGSESEVMMSFDNGSNIVEGFLVHKPKTVLNGPFAEQLGLELTPEGDIKTIAPFFESSRHGVFALGDCGVPGKAVATAISSGVYGAGGIVMQLLAEEGHAKVA